MDLKSLESELLKLSSKERAVIIYKLLESLENDNEENVEEVWLKEALGRYNAIKGKKSAMIESEMIIKEAKSKYK